MSDETYAWYMYPEPDGKSYHEKDLGNPSIVQEVFDYCQINLASISDKGWQFLLSNYSIEQLKKIDTQSGWFQPCSDAEFSESINYMALVSGYNPETNQFGIYDEENSAFKTKS